ncbi:MAG: glycosyltransferase family 39 protein [Anaerolineae bacterium]
MRDRLRDLGLLLLLLAYGGLAVAYASTTPLFESPDESSHLQVIRYIGRTGQLPPYQLPERRADTGPNMAWAIRYHDPPLYYAPPLYHALGALLTAWAPMDDLPERLMPSPSWEAGYAPQRGTDPWNKNVFAHLATETLAQSSTLRATAVLRAVSIVLGAVTLVSTYGMALQVWPDAKERALGAAAVVAINPQFIASQAGVSNDPLTIALCSLTLVWMLRLLRRGSGWFGWAVLGVPVGLGLLTKQSALMLLPLGGVAALLSAFKREAPWEKRISRGLKRGLVFGAAALLIGGAWYAANLLSHGDLLGTAPHTAAQVALPCFGWEALAGTLQSYWAAFGWALILAPFWVYAVAAVLAILALGGVVKALVAEGASRSLVELSWWQLGLLAFAVLMNGLALTRWAKATGAPYGRLLFPTVGPVGVLAVWGLGQWRGHWYRRGLVVGVAALACFTLLAPWLSLRPAFASPYLPKGVPPSARPVDDGNAGPVSLRGFQVAEQSFLSGLVRARASGEAGREGAVDLAPGDTVAVTLFWRGERPGEERLTTWVQLAGIDPTAQVAGDTRWLGGTLYPANLWREGDVVAHHVTLDIPSWAPAPALYWIRVGLLDSRDQVISFERGDHVGLGPWRLRTPTAIPDEAVSADVQLGPAIRLSAHEIEAAAEGLIVCLYWEATAVPEQDYTVFVHVTDAEGLTVGQRDAMPRGGAYPTSWWLPGDVVPDCYTFPYEEIGEGPGRLQVGMYLLETKERLPAHDAGGDRLRDDALDLEWR